MKNTKPYQMSNRETWALAAYWAEAYAIATFCLQEDVACDPDDFKDMAGATEAFDDLVATGYITKDDIEKMITSHYQKLKAKP